MKAGAALSDPTQWDNNYSHRRYRMRGIYERNAGFLSEADGREYEAAAVR
jgi:hypothetical protein